MKYIYQLTLFGVSICFVSFYHVFMGKYVCICRSDDFINQDYVA